MNADGLILGAAFMLMVGTVIFIVIMDMPKRYRILAKGLLIVGPCLWYLTIFISWYYLELENIEKIGRVLFHILVHLGIIVIIFGKLHVLSKDIKYRDSKWKLTNDQSLYTYIAAYLLIHLIGFSTDIDAFKAIVITEDTSQVTSFGAPFALSLIAGIIVYYYNVCKSIKGIT